MTKDNLIKSVNKKASLLNVATYSFDKSNHIDGYLWKDLTEKELLSAINTYSLFLDILDKSK